MIVTHVILRSDFSYCSFNPFLFNQNDVMISNPKWSLIWIYWVPYVKLKFYDLKNGVSLFFKDFALYHREVYLKKVNWVGSSTFLCLQLWTTLSIWIISSDHSGWFSTWTTWFLVELWEPLGDWTCSCVLSSQGLKVFNFPSLSVIYPNEMFSFVVLVWGAYDVIFFNFLEWNFYVLLTGNLLCLQVLWDCWRGSFKWKDI